MIHYNSGTKVENIISVSEARRLVDDHITELSPVFTPLPDSPGLLLAKDVIAEIDIPGWTQSSMDGYAIRFADLDKYAKLEIKGEIAAGSKAEVELATGQAVRIFTGAPLSPGADTVVMQEKTRTENGFLIIDDPLLRQGTNVRDRGAEIRAGQSALRKGTLMRPAAIGFLASLGITDVWTYPAPKVHIIVTGNELRRPGQPLDTGQIYDSNSWSLQAALKSAHVPDAKIVYAKDDPGILAQIIAGSLENADVVLLTGGVSVGDYDFVAGAAKANGVEKIFHRVKQRPGKPLFFGSKKNKFLFGLPGNPASALSCFYIYVEPLLKKMSGLDSGIRRLRVPMADEYKKQAGLTYFLKGHYDGTMARLLSGQESFRLSSFAVSNCLVQVEEDILHCGHGDEVEIFLLP